MLANPSHPYTRALLSVVPETGHTMNHLPVVLQGEPPDPSRIPVGCRFHPRCPALASGEAAAAGVDGDCRNTALPVLPLLGAGEKHQAA